MAEDIDELDLVESSDEEIEQEKVPSLVKVIEQKPKTHDGLKELSKEEKRAKLRKAIAEKKSERMRRGYVETATAQKPKVSNKAGKRGQAMAIDPKMIHKKFEGVGITDMAGLLGLFMEHPEKLKDYIQFVGLPKKMVYEGVKNALDEKAKDKHIDEDELKQVDQLMKFIESD